MTDISNLKKEASEIDKEIKKSEKNLENIGTLAIRIQKFVKLVEYLEEINDEIKELKIMAEYFNKKIIQLSNLRVKKRQEDNQEMIRSRLTPDAPYTECTTDDKDFFIEKTHRVNNILTNAIDVLESVKKQGKYIERTSSRIKGGLLKLGMSKELVNEIDRRYLADNRIFVTGFVILLVFFFLLRFWFR
ncbi:hypothetical protein P3W45_000692 [Vairimorpha bombi]|jgi:hypothetical protein